MIKKIEWDDPMLFHVKKEALRNLAKCFYDVSGTILSVYDANKNHICSYPQKMCQFCRKVRNYPILEKCCLECDRAALTKCDETRKVYIYRCHMGLIEVAAPIIYNEIIIGYMQFGQITSEASPENLHEHVCQIAEENKIASHLLTENLHTVVARSPEYIASISQMMEMCACYIWQNSFISVKNESVSQSISLYIQEHIQDALNISRLCEVFHLSRSSLYNIAKTYFGCGITEYVTACRITAAKKLLREKDISVASVGEQVGFSDTNYFIRCFKKHVGISPKKYQNQFQE